MRHVLSVLCSLFSIICLLPSCREVPTVYYDETLRFDSGVYVLCEGNMGTNKATIDYYDLRRDTLIRNIYPLVNPRVVFELGDVGNDIAIYGGKLYAVVNCSHKVEVMTTQCRRLTSITIPNCRSLAFSGRYAYVSSYAGPVEIRPDYAQRGYVARLDTATLRVVDTCLVGYQPNDVVAHGGYLYVANSGGYMAPNYDSTVSVIRLSDFTEVARIPVAINLDALCLDSVHGYLYVTSQGDYMSHPMATYRIHLSDRRVEQMPFIGSGMSLVGDSLYFYSYTFADAAYGIYDTGRDQLVPFVPSYTRPVPHGIYADPCRDRVYLTFSPSYTNPGYLGVYTRSGQLISTHRTGDIPAHMAGL